MKELLFAFTFSILAVLTFAQKENDGSLPLALKNLSSGEEKGVPATKKGIEMGLQTGRTELQ